MNIAFILRSFGVNVDEAQVRELERAINSGEMRAAIESAVRFLNTAEARFCALEAAVADTHRIAQKLLGANPLEAEWERQFILHPPEYVHQAADAGARIVERMTENVGRTANGHSESGDAADGSGKFAFPG